MRERQKGTTGSAGVSLAHGFGEGDAHNIGGYVGYVTTSNAAASSGSFSRRGGGTRPLRPRGGSSGGDSWAEYGANAGFALGGGLSLTLSAMRTAGMTGPESTSLSTGLQFGF